MGTHSHVQEFGGQHSQTVGRGLEKNTSLLFMCIGVLLACVPVHLSMQYLQRTEECVRYLGLKLQTVAS